MIPVDNDHSLLEETTTFVDLGSCGSKPLNWGESGDTQGKPGQPNERSVLGHRSPVTSRQRFIMQAACLYPYGSLPW